MYMFDISLCWAITLPYFHCSYTYLTENGMQVCIYNAKVHKDKITLRWLGTAVANIYFYHGTVVKVKKKNSAYDLTFTVYVPLCPISIPLCLCPIQSMSHNNNNNNNKKKILILQ